jgi:nucleoside-diphosphate-sugar epimerase
MKGCTLVTGGSGFIGVSLIKALVEKGVTVINYDISPPTQELQNYLGDLKDKILFVKGNILDMPTLISAVKENKVDRIMHMAALFDWQESNRIPYFTHQVNVGGTLNVLEAARIFDIDRVVLASSIAVYPEKMYEPIDEKHPILFPGIAHGSHYGASKGVGEVLGLAYWKNNGVSFVSLRFSGVYGYGMRYSMFIKDMIENALQNKPTNFMTGGELRRDYTYVKDCVEAIMSALYVDDKKMTKRVYLTASGEFYSASEVAQAVKELVPGATIEIGSKLNDAEIIDATKRGKLDISLAYKELGYIPQFKLREGVEDYIKLFKEYSSKQ